MRVEHIGNATLYLGDCREVLPTLGKVDAVVTDPPYGLGDKLRKGGGGWSGLVADGVPWDDAPELALHDALMLTQTAIVWGGNYYALPPKRGWLLWDKKQSGGFTSGHAELAWTTIDQPVRAFRMSQVEAYCPPHAEPKVHPTQKPLKLMEWCLGFIPKAQVILDPFMGSGSTGVACARHGRSFIGIERDPAYFEMACERIAGARPAASLFAA